MKKLFCFIKILLAISAFAIACAAQKTDYKPGEKIEYKASYSKDEWVTGTFVEKSYDGSQPVIRDAQNFQIALPNWGWVRPFTAESPTAKSADENNQTAENDNPVIMTGGDGLMSQTDILNFAQTNLGGNPVSNLRRSEIIQNLVGKIKNRGVDFHYDGTSSFAKALINAIGGMDLDLTWSLRDNYGAPTTQSWLTGSWKLDIVGATTDYEKNGDIYRKEASAAANVGRLTINADETYVWQADAPNETFTGKWRKATLAEMMSQGGDGIVLLNAKSGWDWIVTQLRGSSVLKGDVIYVSYLKGRGVREIGSR